MFFINNIDVYMNNKTKIYTMFLSYLRKRDLDSADKLINLIRKNKKVENTFIKKMERERSIINSFVFSKESIYVLIVNECDYSCKFCDRSSSYFKNNNNYNYQTSSNYIEFLCFIFKNEIKKINYF